MAKERPNLSEDAKYRKGGHEDRLGKREDRLRKANMYEISPGKKVSSDTGDLVHSKAGDTRVQAASKRRQGTSDGYMVRAQKQADKVNDKVRKTFQNPKTGELVGRTGRDYPRDSVKGGVRTKRFGGAGIPGEKIKESSHKLDLKK